MAKKQSRVKVLDQHHGNHYTLYGGDSVEVFKGLPDNSIDLTITSPPFCNLYLYSDSPRDMGNTNGDDHFFEHFRYLIGELWRVTTPGRLCVIHCKDLPLFMGSDGHAGLRDFPGDIRLAFESFGWVFHSRVTIWKCPKIEMERTNNHGLLHSQLCKDSSVSRQGMAEYLMVFRKWSEGMNGMNSAKPVTRPDQPYRFNNYIGPDAPETDPTIDARQFSIEVWRRYASPVWMDIQQTNVLNAAIARKDGEPHICPLQLDVIQRCVELWSNPGDVVCDPFNGIGSTGVESLKMGRKYIGCELKPEYFQRAISFLDDAETVSQCNLIAG
jgi:DNA modification methylase